MLVEMKTMYTQQQPIKSITRNELIVALKKFQKRVTFESYLDFLILVFGRRAAQNFIRYLLRTILDALSNE